MKSLSYEELRDIIIPKLIKNQLAESRIDMVSDAINFTVYTAGLQSAYDYVLNHIGNMVDLNFISEVNKRVLYKAGNGGKIRPCEIYIPDPNAPIIIPPIDEDSIKSELLKQYDIHDNVMRAIVLYCFIKQNQLFFDGNTRTANIICNHVLLSNLIGYVDLSCVSPDKLSNAALDMYNGDVSTIVKILLNNIVTEV